jgi:hypothetical protein
MSAIAQDQDAEPDWVVVAQAEGILSARHHFGIAEATARLRAEAFAVGVSIEELAEDLVRSAGVPDRRATPPYLRVARPRSGCLDLDEEVALHEEMRSRRPEPLVLDGPTEAALRRLLS